MAISNDWLKKFTAKSMQNVMAYLLTQNLVSQTFAIDGVNAENVQTTGTGLALLNGAYIASLPEDAEYDIATELPYAAWAASTAYTTGGAVSEVVNKESQHFVCIEAHTSAAADEPGFGANWRTYWKRLDKWAEAAVGDVVTDGTTKYFLCCALADGTLRLFKAYDADLALEIPAYDSERYIPIGLLIVAASGADATIGTTALTSIGTFVDLLGPVFPAAVKLDRN